MTASAPPDSGSACAAAWARALAIISSLYGTPSAAMAQWKPAAAKPSMNRPLATGNPARSRR